MKAKYRIILLLVLLGGEPAWAQTTSLCSHATAYVKVNVAPHISVSNPVMVTIDLRENQTGIPIPARVQLAVTSNMQDVELQVACTDLYLAGDPTCGWKIPVAGAGARLTCSQGYAVAGSDSLLPWQPSPTPGLLPAGWTGAVSTVGVFTASPAAVFNQNVAVDVSWTAMDPALPLGEYSGYVRLIGLVRP